MAAANFVQKTSGLAYILARGVRAGPAISQVQQRRSISGTLAGGIPRAKYGGRHTVTMMPGDGIGPQMMGYVQDIFTLVGAPVDFEVVKLDPSNDSYEDLNNAISSVKRNGCAIKANIETRMNQPHIKSRNVEMRNALDLFVNVLHCKSIDGIQTRHKNIDIIVVRQNTEGEYSMLEHENVSGVIESLKVVTEKNTERLCRYAFEFACSNGRKKVTIVHKANIMKLTDGLFLATGQKVARDYPGIECDHMIIDNCCMQLVSNPWQFDVMVLTNLYGTIVSNLVCGLIGGPGVTSGRNFGPDYAMFEPGTRNTGSGLVGKNVANPMAMLKAGVDLLRYLELDKHAAIVDKAISKTLSADKIHTKDLGGTSSSSDVIEGVVKHIKNQLN